MSLSSYPSPWAVLTIVLATFASPTTSPLHAAADDPMPVEVRGGVAAFDAATNVSAISIHGKSAALAGRAVVRPGDNGLIIERLEASVPVKTLNTGMGLRDGHMQRQVFTTADGKMPDLIFSADGARCQGAEAQRSCQLTGQLSVRGVNKPFAMTLNVKKEGAAYRAAGDGVVRLSSYGIAPPSQLGVTVADDVKLHLEFVARPTETTIATRGVQ